MTDPGDADDIRRPEEGLPTPRDGGLGSRHDGDPTRSELSSAAFDEIVAGWNAEGSVPRWPASADRPLPKEAQAEPAEAPEPSDTPEPPEPPEPPESSELVEVLEVLEPSMLPATGDDAHFVPPEPPPLPRLGSRAMVGLALLALGLILIVAPSWIGLPRAFSLPLGLLTLACGVGWLVLRIWPAPPPTGDGDGQDDGAVL